MPFKTTVVFDRVFGVNHTKGETSFGFESQNRMHYSVSVAAMPVLEPGMKVTALLRREDDWVSPLGWVNHDNGDIVQEPFVVPACVAIFAGTWCVLALRPPAANWILAGIFGLVAGSAAVGCVQGIQVNRELRAIRRELIRAGELLL